MKKEILDNELAKIGKISKEFDVAKVFLFGSCLESVETANDIDIAVKGINPRDFFKYYGRISMAVDDAVDLVDLDDVREHFQKRILSKGRIIYERAV
ncbi:MAG: nucleotidyltransferase domain-containing protein [Candidatus Omnitrophica bacterium]|nr:nucleotidyltransferase domain-containing protein [Candidatus Omnitrophota bacterium]